MDDQINQSMNNLAHNVKAFRQKRNYTQEAFSSMSGVARSTLTNIESGESNPSLSNIIKISKALDVSVDQLIAKPTSATVLVKVEDLSKEYRGKGIEIHHLLPDLIKGVSIDRVSIDAGEIFRGMPHLNGTREYLTVVKGKLEVVVRGEEFKVNEKEVLAFAGDENHSYRNIGSETLTYISIVIPK